MHPLRCLLLLAFFVPAIAFAQLKDCKLMHQGKFKYMAGEEEVIITIQDSSMVEYHQGGKYIIKTRIDWINDCEYTITILKVTVPEFALGTGDQVNVKINRVEGKELYYTLTVKSVSWQGKFIKLE
jgi:hypothetical protein